jgi:hypothetical protein
MEWRYSASVSYTSLVKPHARHLLIAIVIALILLAVATVVARGW